MTITEYEREFVRLCKYARECVSREAIKCKRFDDRLNDDIRLSVGVLKIKEFIVLVERSYDGSILAELRAKPMFLEEICKAQKDDSELQAKRAQCETGVESNFQIGSDGCLMFRNRICVSKNDELVRKILQEAHSSSLSIHPSSTKIYNDLKKMYWWVGIERDISEFVYRCLICQ
ncbi:uncharacterized protein LOC128042504 [Gossypium raimondii]|uniref:uncharacterized protein LOC128042504 n=1 Tax=Gossypium raimondii TaxID=29730 RepID=UPI00227B976D|nr:uncharacterized protein LOC128042504 [Gossypium raimondii]